MTDPEGDRPSASAPIQTASATTLQAAEMAISLQTNTARPVDRLDTRIQRASAETASNMYGRSTLSKTQIPVGPTVAWYAATAMAVPEMSPKITLEDLDGLCIPAR
ncbi:unannotated protein [freshwater metagenome]|uniref:Unannotated protein n=1 Tax=freshwater metagenome TaxID=449393 RepID=A0A6J6ASD5_9ZZZZ